MQEKLLSIGDDYWIEDESGQRVFKVDGKAVRVRDTFVLEDAPGSELAKIQERKLSVRDKMKIEMGDRSATVHKAMVGIRDRYKIDVDGGPDLSAHGNIVDHEYKIERDGDTVANGLEELVPGPRDLRRRDRAGPGRRAHPRDHGVHGLDGARVAEAMTRTGPWAPTRSRSRPNTASFCSQQKTCNRTLPTENFPQCARGPSWASVRQAA